MILPQDPHSYVSVSKNIESYFQNMYNRSISLKVLF